MNKQLLAGYGTDMRPKNLLKNVEAAHDRIWNKFETKKYAQKCKSFQKHNIRHIKRSMPRTIHRQDFLHTAAEMPTN